MELQTTPNDKSIWKAIDAGQIDSGEDFSGFAESLDKELEQKEQPEREIFPASDLYVLANDLFAKYVGENPLNEKEKKQLHEAFSKVEKKYMPDIDVDWFVFTYLAAVTTSIHAPRLVAKSKKRKAEKKNEQKGDAETMPPINRSSDGSNRRDHVTESTHTKSL